MVAPRLFIVATNERVTVIVSENLPQASNVARRNVPNITTPVCFASEQTRIVWSNLEENSTSVSEAATAAVACDVSPIVATWLVCCLIRYTRQESRVITGETSSLESVAIPRENCTATCSNVLDAPRPCHQTSCQSSARSDYEIRSHDLRQRRFRKSRYYLRTSRNRFNINVSQTSACLSLSGDKIYVNRYKLTRANKY